MGRGPSYPYIGLEEAVAQSRKVYDYAKRGTAVVESVVTEGLKYSATSSSGEKVLAALKAFGLIEDATSANGKSSIKLTQRAIRILLDDQNSAERQEEIRNAAISPKWYEYCWKKWGTEMPPAMRSNLLIEHGFVDSTIDGFLKNYKATIAFAGISGVTPAGKTTESETESSYRPKVGDWVQWESQGVLRMPAAKKVASFSPEGDFVFLDGSNGTGVPLKEVIPADPPEEEQVKAPQASFVPSIMKPIISGGTKMQTETFALPEGVTGQLQWPSEITAEAFEDFVYQLEGLRRRVARAVKKPNSEPDVTSSSEG